MATMMLDDRTLRILVVGAVGAALLALLVVFAERAAIMRTLEEIRGLPDTQPDA